MFSFQYCVQKRASGRKYTRNWNGGALYLDDIADYSLAVLHNEAKVGVAMSKYPGLGANAASDIDH